LNICTCSILRWGIPWNQNKAQLMSDGIPGVAEKPTRSLLAVSVGVCHFCLLTLPTAMKRSRSR